MVSHLIIAGFLVTCVISLTRKLPAGVDLKLPVKRFGGAIEAAAVDPKGNVFAADFATIKEKSTAYGSIYQVNGTITDNTNPFVVLTQTDEDNVPLISGARFLSADQLLLTDAANKRVLLVQNKIVSSTFCTDAKMLQPNDIALFPGNKELIYLSGQNYTSDTTAGASGDLWTCSKDGKVVQFPADLLAKADIHRTNGIETSPNSQVLYLSSASNVQNKVVSNKIYRISIDKSTGSLNQEVPKVFYEYTGDDASVDIDGMRTDVDGNLYVTRNGKGEVDKFSPEGQLLMTIFFPGMGGPSSLEFGGVEGKTLYVVGKCAEDDSAGCAGFFQTDAVGKAFAALQI